MRDGGQKKEKQRTAVKLVGHQCDSHLSVANFKKRKSGGSFCTVKKTNVSRTTRTRFTCSLADAWWLPYFSFVIRIAPCVFSSSQLFCTSLGEPEMSRRSKRTKRQRLFTTCSSKSVTLRNTLSVKNAKSRSFGQRW